MKKNKTVGIIIAIASAVVYGVYPATSRAVYMDGGNPTFVVMLTTCARAAVLVLFCVFLRKPLLKTREDVKQAFSGGFLQAISVIGVCASLAYLPGPIMIIILFTHTLMLLFFMAWRGEIKLNGLTLATTFAALIGLSFVLNIWHPQRLSFIGVGIAFVASIATVIRLYIFGSQTKTRNPAIVGAEVFLFAAFFVLLLPIFSTPFLPVSMAGYGWASLTCVSVVLGTFGMFYGISILGAFEYSLLCKIEPIFTAIFSAVLIHEYLLWHQYVGMIVVLGSLAAYQVGTFRANKHLVMQAEQ